KKAEKTSIKTSLADTLTSINESLASFERIYTVVIVKDDWTIENGILTPTLKIKRNAVSNYYEPYLQDWIEKKESIVWE
ncbi:MAG TPA: AMP-dependent synthetase, partial [Flavilitoribacter sp.]|nr:AMP-dependent synthetase [Flavilitoribacter sp.]